MLERSLPPPSPLGTEGINPELSVSWRSVVFHPKKGTSMVIVQCAYRLVAFLSIAFNAKCFKGFQEKKLSTFYQMFRTMHSLPQIFIFCSFRFSLSVPNEVLQTLKILLLQPRKTCQTPVHPLRDISKKKHLRHKGRHHLAMLRSSTQLLRNSCTPFPAFQSFQQAFLFDFQREVGT